MDKKEMMAQIIARVAEKLAQAGEDVTVDQVMRAMGVLEDAKALPGLLILTQDHGCVCHALLENDRINEKYRTCCALAQEDQVELDGVDTVVLFNLTIENMCKIVSGITDTSYTKLAAKALLSGKKIYAPREEVELYQYPVGGLGSYQCMLQAKLTKLISWGVKICPMEQLEECILKEASVAEPEKECGSCCGSQEENCEADCAAEELPCEEAAAEVKEITFSKRVITERDVIEAKKNDVQVIRITSKNILTALAKDAASVRNIRVIRE